MVKKKCELAAVYFVQNRTFSFLPAYQVFWWYDVFILYTGLVMIVKMFSHCSLSLSLQMIKKDNGKNSTDSNKVYKEFWLQDLQEYKVYKTFVISSDSSFVCCFSISTRITKVFSFAGFMFPLYQTVCPVVKRSLKIFIALWRVRCWTKLEGRYFWSLTFVGKIVWMCVGRWASRGGCVHAYV